jgi:hypothetical protein
LAKDGRDKGAGRAFAFGSGNVDGVQSVEIGGLWVFGVSRVYRLYLSWANAHLVAQLLDPFNHFRDSILIHAPSRLADCVDDGKVALQRVQCRYGCLSRLVSRLSADE